MMTFLEVSGLVRVASDPQLSYTANSTPVVSFSVAANRKWTDEGGKDHEESCFIDCTAWSKLAEAINNHVQKGDPLHVSGHLKQERWEKDGHTHSKHALTLHRAVFLKGREPGEDSGSKRANGGDSSRARR